MGKRVFAPSNMGRGCITPFGHESTRRVRRWMKRKYKNGSSRSDVYGLVHAAIEAQICDDKAMALSCAYDVIFGDDKK